MQARRRGETARPKAVVRLMEMEGPAKASRELGVSTTLLHNARKSGEVTKSVELAALAILERLPHKPIVADAEETGRALVLLEVPQKSVAALRKVAEYLGASMLEA